jgi:hypothetical protein
MASKVVMKWRNENNGEEIISRENGIENIS